jgi:ABC-type multidrug transport system permease subunit
MNGICGIYLRELLIFKSKFFKNLLASVISPLLFLFAFGFGIGKHTQINGINYISFLLPGLLTMTTLNQAYGISSEINISRFYFKIFDEYLIAPIGRWQILLGESFYGVTKGFISAAIIIILAYILDIKFSISFLFIFILMLHLLIFSMLGFSAALIVRNHGDQFAINSFIITPMVFLSGTFYPIDMMPSIVKYVVHVFPLTYTTALLRDAFLFDKLFSIPYLLVSFFILITLFIFGVFIVRKIE